MCWARVWAVVVPGASGIRGTKEQRPQQAPDCGAWHIWGTARSRPLNRPGEDTAIPEAALDGAIGLGDLFGVF